MLSANNTFIDIPILKMNKPFKISLKGLNRLNFNCGMSALGSTIGPAINCGKKNRYDSFVL